MAFDDEIQSPDGPAPGSPREIKWTQSKMFTLQGCGEFFQRLYINRDVPPPAPRMIRGSAMHRAIRHSMKTKMAIGLLPSEAETKAVAADEFARRWMEGVTLDPEEIKEAGSVGAVEAQAKDMAVNLAGLHRREAAPRITPIAVEQRITIAQANLAVAKSEGLSITLEGTLDLADQTGDGVIVADAKSGQRSPPATAADDSQQFTFYGMLWLAHAGRMPLSYRQDHLIQTPKRQELKYVPLATERDMDDFRSMIRRINTATLAVEKGIFLPRNQEDWQCRLCPVRDTCPYIGRTRPRN